MDGDPGALVTPRTSGPEVVGSNPTGPTRRHSQVCYSESGFAICYLLQLVPTGFGRESSEKSNLGCFQTCEESCLPLGPRGEPDLLGSQTALKCTQRRRFRLNDLSRRLYRCGRLPEDSLRVASPCDGRVGSRNFEPPRFSGKSPSGTSRRSDDVIFLIRLKPSSS